MTFKNIATAAALVATVLATPAFAQTAAPPGGPAGALIKPGLWEITAVSETPGSNTSRSVVSRSCFSAEDVASVQRLLPRQRETGMQCENRDLKPQALGATWLVSCTAKGATLAGAAKLSFASGAYVGSADLEMKKQGAKPTKVNQRYSGKLLGECK